MWSALFKYILTTAVMCASQGLNGAEKRQIRDGKEKQAVFCLVSTTRSEVRNDAGSGDKKKKDQAIFRVHVCGGKNNTTD